MNNNLKVKDIVYHTRIFPTLGIYDLNELKIRTISDDYFVGIEKYTKRAFLFCYNSIGKNVFFNRKDALAKVKEAEKYRIKIIEDKESYYYEDED